MIHFPCHICSHLDLDFFNEHFKEIRHSQQIDSLFVFFLHKNPRIKFIITVLHICGECVLAFRQGVVLPSPNGHSIKSIRTIRFVISLYDLHQFFVHPKPVLSIFIIRKYSFNSCPERKTMILIGNMAQFMHYHIINHRKRTHY